VDRIDNVSVQKNNANSGIGKGAVNHIFFTKPQDDLN